ncbi:hypothetical protein PR001_g4828 [Phytophthora rubi]|uniref:Uncharacterized protein n=1 Tax=Phytophthora rubi TaxID=129364 RepID=A0A6A3NT14_9STRA|nr:hypothetical protein PR002_g4672 [Phytophthora rubi]KAE9045757.1 hypothetical protein PR001_g4828 [Phytophthora rubi]
MVTVNSDVADVPPVRMSYLNSFYYDVSFDSVGIVTFVPTCDDPFRNRVVKTVFWKNIDITGHDGVGVGMALGGQVVTASATELNYVDVPVGLAVSHKALVLGGIVKSHLQLWTSIMHIPQPTLSWLYI